jgi:hypothetical protein
MTLTVESCRNPMQDQTAASTRFLRRDSRAKMAELFGNPMYILYGGDFTRAVLVQWVLEEGKLDYELRKIDILKGEHRAAEFLAINPAGFVPVLITPDGDALYEVAALIPPKLGDATRSS